MHVALERALVDFSLSAKRVRVEVDFDTPDAWLVHDRIGSPRGYCSLSFTTWGCAAMGCGGFRSHPIAGEAIRTRDGSGAAEFDNVFSGCLRRFPTAIRPSEATQLAKVACRVVADLATVTAAQVPSVSGQSDTRAIPLHPPASW